MRDELALARRLYHLDTRTIPGKLHQILRAVQLEFLYTKDEILTAYVNLAPYGSNVEGVAAASLIYFGKRASKLTLGEALTLAVIPAIYALWRGWRMTDSPARSSDLTGDKPEG